MKTWIRWCALLPVLAATVVGQRAWQRHLEAAAPALPTSLLQPLAALPLTLGDWRGQNEVIADPRYLYADEHLQRIYVHLKTKQVVTVWGVFSSTGADRGHHPEVCLAVAGQAEDESVRTTLDVPGHVQPVQQYRFVAGGRGQGVCYWYYTLPAPRDERLDATQAAYRKLHVRPASLTLEVFAPENGPRDGEAAREFVQLLDAAVQPLVGPTAERGSRRLPVTVVPGV